ncbi:MAG: alpha/beta fold hydrolase [Acidimicrobiales bacterium]
MTEQLHAATGGHEHSGRPVVVMIHGAGGNRSVWAGQARHLAARGLDVLAYDLPGHGLSAGKPHTTVEAYADAVVADLDSRGVENFALVGHSLGSLIAIRIAASAPDRINKLALLGAGPELAVNDDLLTATADDPATAIDAIIDWGHSQSTHVGGGQAPGLWMDGTDTAILRREVVDHPGTLHADFIASNSFDGGSLTDNITAPTLIISGSADLMASPKLGRALQEQINGSELVWLEGCGHFMMTERPSEVCRLLATFLGGL